ncbi:MAG: hypothetical protein ACPGWR_03330 [Ardenticatenaceae bacterium]
MRSAYCVSEGASAKSRRACTLTETSWQLVLPSPNKLAAYSTLTKQASSLFYLQRNKLAAYFTFRETS